MSLISDVHECREGLRQVAEQVDANHDRLGVLEEQVNGQRGLSSAVDNLAIQLARVWKAGYWLAGVLVLASITFAFSVLRLVA